MRIGSALFLLALGAILAFAVNIDPTPVAGLTVRWDTVGVILMIVGAIGVVWAIAAMNSARRAGYVEPAVVERETWVER